MSNEEMIDKLLESVGEDTFEPNVFELIANGTLDVIPDGNGDRCFVYYQGKYKKPIGITADGEIHQYRELAEITDMEVWHKDMPSDLSEYLHSVSLNTSCGYIRSYYDPQHYGSGNEYDYENSSLIHNFFACVEEVTDSLIDEDIEKAEWLITEYSKDFIPNDSAEEKKNEIDFDGCRTEMTDNIAIHLSESMNDMFKAFDIDIEDPSAEFNTTEENKFAELCDMVADFFTDYAKRKNQ